ncbi:hypothetical protein ACF07T_40345 [Streptomyces sp. NPDC015184]|uniref:hypothetical protein n=1 Tax=Streptomyces sp. NPDC015184 TaxID=3364946 RepID=UPI0036F7ABFB
MAFAEAPQPVPGPGEAPVEVEALAPNRGETFVLERPRPGPLPGKDVAGPVVRASADGSGPGIGIRVAGHPAQGGRAEHVAVPTRSPAVLPDTVDGVRAAVLPPAGITALRLLRTAGCLAGRRVLPTGASGGVGHQDRPHPEIYRTSGWTRTSETLVGLREHRMRGRAVLLAGGTR